MSYLLDTNVVSALRRRDQAEKRVLDWFETAAAAEFFVSVLTMMEIEIGVRRLELTTGAKPQSFAHGRKGLSRPGFAAFLEHRLRNRRALRRAARSRSAAGNRRLDRGDRDRQAADAGDAKRRDFAGMPVAIVNPWSAAP